MASAGLQVDSIKLAPHPRLLRKMRKFRYSLNAMENKMDLQTIDSRQTEASSAYHNDNIAAKHVPKLDAVHEVCATAYVDPYGVWYS